MDEICAFRIDNDLQFLYLGLGFKMFELRDLSHVAQCGKSKLK